MCNKLSFQFHVFSYILIVYATFLFSKISQSVYDIINPFKICVHMATAAQQDSDNTVHAFLQSTNYGTSLVNIAVNNPTKLLKWSTICLECTCAF